MNGSERTALLLRQVAALRRRGRGHDEALALSRAGLPPGPLADRVDGVLRTLAAGGAPEAAGDSLDQLLGAADAPVEALDHGAAALDARLSADAALSLIRLYATMLVAGPILLVSLQAWFGADGSAFSQGISAWPWDIATAALTSMKYAGVPLAVAAVIVIRLATTHFAPGTGRLRRAAALLQAAAVGTVPLELLGGPVQTRYFSARRPVCGEAQAAAEVAAELVREAEERLILFRHLAPVAAAVVVFLAAWLTVVLLFLPLYQQGRLF